MPQKDIKSKAKQIKLLLLDVDGVLTDGSIIYNEQGEEIKIFNARDGAMIKWLKRAGIKTAILSGRESRAVEHRAEELEIDVVIQNAKDKLKAFDNFLSEPSVECILHQLYSEKFPD